MMQRLSRATLGAVVAVLVVVAMGRDAAGDVGGASKNKARIVTDENDNLHIRSLNNTYMWTRANTTGGGGGGVFVDGVSVHDLINEVSTLKREAANLRMQLAEVRALAAPNTTETECLIKVPGEVDCGNGDSVLSGVCEASDISRCCCDAVQDITVVDGTIDINPLSPTTAATMARLLTVGGNLRATSLHVSSISFPALRTVGEEVYFRTNNALTAVHLPALQSVGLDLKIESNDALTVIDFPSLQVVSGAMDVKGNTAMLRLHLPALVSTGDIRIESNDVLTDLTIGGPERPLRVFGVLQIQSNTALKSLTFTSSSAEIAASFAIRNNPKLGLVECIGDFSKAPCVNFYGNSNDATLGPGCPAICQFV
ncbi:hypothetical protein PTSG_10807 [Salpingoeca rosetta]|uniref:Uncharacterized protein n=1 Tax=Salpingoeca rosetta (strain ATCC 50818 / BSB-021) TaxID=946362 RepID=F2UPZ4_SALR5|nr:uncharacterized protein PTSG_10807 [Salpingoeca rosetta]EGD79824.1 hypothetical protein PTSG_10807 [Salpingoeca rosetta]|eukprot:XP_004988772.1 hypothetical protein PTSG_10807 [Salpingoeca rosetta]